MTIPSARILATAFLCGVGAACGAKAATSTADAGAPPGESLADAGADAAPVRSPCAGGGSRGTQFRIDPVDRGIRLLGAAHGHVFWVAPVFYEIWSMSRDGTDMHVIHTAERAMSFRLGTDGVYVVGAADWSIQRIPFEGGDPTLTRVIGHEIGVIGDDADNVYTFDGFGGMVSRVAKAGSGAAVQLRSGSGAYPMLGGAFIWLDVSADGVTPDLGTGVSRFDAHGTGSPVTLVDSRACESLLVDATHAVCERDGEMSTLSADGSARTILSPPSDPVTPTVSGSPPPFRGPIAFARHGGRDGVLFMANGPKPPTSVNWISLEGGAPVELSCVDGAADVAVDGDDLFLVYGGYVSRVDLR